MTNTFHRQNLCKKNTYHYVIVKVHNNKKKIDCYSIRIDIGVKKSKIKVIGNTICDLND